MKGLRVKPKLETTVTPKAKVQAPKIPKHRYVLGKSKMAKMNPRAADYGLVAELAKNKTKFSKSGLRIVAENGTKDAGLEHITQRHWNPKELMKFSGTIEEMITKIHETISTKDPISKSTSIRNGRTGHEFIYKFKFESAGISKNFKLAVGSNGFIVSFYPQ